MHYLWYGVTLFSNVYFYFYNYVLRPLDKLMKPDLSPGNWDIHVQHTYKDVINFFSFITINWVTDQFTQQNIWYCCTQVDSCRKYAKHFLWWYIFDMKCFSCLSNTFVWFFFSTEEICVEAVLSLCLLFKKDMIYDM